MSLSNGGSVDLSTYVNTDNQDLAISNNSLSLTNDPTSVDLSGYLDNTDNQTLSLNSNTLSLTNGGSVDLSVFDNGNTTQLTDADNDTKIQIEESTDDDIIRMDVAGTEVFTVKKNANGYTLFETPGSGGNSTHFGQDAGEATSTGTYNALFGKRAGAALTTGNDNTLVSGFAGDELITGSNNTFLGRAAGGSLFTSGNNNTFLGKRTGYNNNGSSNVFIGHYAGYNESGSNKLYIENSNSSTPLIYGEFDNDLVEVNGTLDISDDITMGSQDYHPVAYDSKVLQAFGFVFKEGTLASSSLISNLIASVSKTGTGEYVITMVSPSPFSSTPLAFVTPHSSLIGDKRYAVVNLTGANGIISVKTYNENGVLADSDFTFMIAGSY